MEELTKVQQKIWADILEERIRQNMKFTGTVDGSQQHNISFWKDILDEEIGEVSKEIIEMVYDPKHPKETWESTFSHLREELIQVAALTVAIIERIDFRDYALLMPEEGMYELRNYGPLVRDIIKGGSNA